MVCWIALSWFRIVVGLFLLGLWMVLNGLGMFYVVWECVGKSLAWCLMGFGQVVVWLWDVFGLLLIVFWFQEPRG